MPSERSVKTFRVGSRDSALALAQTGLFIRQLKGAGFDGEFTIIPLKTTGDLIQDRSLEAIGGKGLFVRELDRALLDGEIDFAVHSLKDLPQDLEPGTKIAAFSEREDPRDALVLPPGRALPDLSRPAGCSSKRRIFQLGALFPGWSAAPVRGNVLTRLEKLDRGDYGALILAAAGLKRLGLAARISRCFDSAEMLPSAGQGILCAVTREDAGFDLFAGAGSSEAAFCARAERAFVRALGGDCASPIGAFAEVEGGSLFLRGIRWEGDDPASPPRFGSIRGDPARAEALGAALARELLA